MTHAGRWALAQRLFRIGRCGGAASRRGGCAGLIFRAGVFCEHRTRARARTADKTPRSRTWPRNGTLQNLTFATNDAAQYQSIPDDGCAYPALSGAFIWARRAACYRPVLSEVREALRQLGEEFIEAYVMEGDADDAALWEIDENFARAELTDAQRADHHARRERILVAKGIVKDAPRGGRPRNSDNLSAYSAKAAADLGVDERTVRRDLARGKKIVPEVLADVAGTDLDKGVVLDDLARTPQPEQRDAGGDPRGLQREDGIFPGPAPVEEC